MRTPHCFDAGSTISNASYSIPVGTNGTVGTIYSRDDTAGGLDAELVSTTAGSSSLTWIGGTVTSSYAAFDGAGPLVHGTTLCVSGAFEGEFCGAIVNDVDIPINLCLYTNADGTCGAMRAVSHVSDATLQGHLIVGSGDSGGPAYQYFGSTVKAVGTITGQGVSQACTNWSVQLQGRQCSSEVYVTDIANELALWGLTVN